MAAGDGHGVAEALARAVPLAAGVPLAVGFGEVPALGEPVGEALVPGDPDGVGVALRQKATEGAGPRIV